MARAQWIRHIPANSHQNDLWGEMRSFETDRHVSLPHVVPLVMERDHTAKGLKEKLATKRFMLQPVQQALYYPGRDTGLLGRVDKAKAVMDDTTVPGWRSATQVW